MRFKFIAVPVRDPAPAEDALNRFLASVRIVHLHKHFVDHGENSFWTFAVEYLPGEAADSASRPPSKKPRIDYKEVLSPEDFAVFARLREWRKKRAETDGVPVYTLFANDQLANIARNRPDSRAALKNIEGIGEAKTEKYCDAILQILSETPPPAPSAEKEATDETGREPLPPDTGTR
ncbi:MAG: HRDC domain-containing protein [Desulfococcaceae bacterium]